MLSILLGNGGGGGPGARRLIPSDVPPHIQQMLDPPERQALERRSPLRRPMYRKIVSGASGTSGLLSDSAILTGTVGGASIVGSTCCFMHH